MMPTSTTPRAAPNRVNNRASKVSAMAIAALCLGFPLFQGAISFRGMVASLEAEVEASAAMVDQAMRDDRELSVGHLMAVFRKRPGQDVPLSRIRILDLDGGLVLEGDNRPSGPFLTRSFPIYDSAGEAGRIEISRTLLPLLLRTALFLLLGGGLGTCLLIFPPRAGLPRWGDGRSTPGVGEIALKGK